MNGNNEKNGVLIPASLSGGFLTVISQKFGFDESVLNKRAAEFYNFCRVKDLTLKKEAVKLCQCTPESIQKVFMQIAAWNIPIDSRDFVYLYANNGNMTAEPSYKGLLYVASQNGLTVNAGLIFEGDSFDLEEKANGDFYTIKRDNPFKRKIIQGCFVYVQGKNKPPKCYTFSFEELEAARQASKRKMNGKESPSWAYFPNDMYLKSGIKKALKIAISQIEIKDTVRAMFDDEVPESEEVIEHHSTKTEDFKSLEYLPEEEPEEIQEEETPECLIRLSSTLDKLNDIEDGSISVDSENFTKQQAFINELAEEVSLSGYEKSAEELKELFFKKIKKGI